MRKKLIAGNWKMNLTPSEAAAFAKELAAALGDFEADAVLCVPFIDIPAVAAALKGSGIAVGAQNLHFEDKGAFTGEISAGMLADSGVTHVIVGHSERREYFDETDAIVNKKARKALEAGLVPIICVGERLEQRKQGITADLIRTQVKIAFQGITVTQARETVVAYEPVWAIGTGVTATCREAQEVCAVIRQTLAEMYGADSPYAMRNIRILYGGSMTAKNAAELFSMPDIDGGLVGGASLKAEFKDIVKYK